MKKLLLIIPLFLVISLSMSAQYGTYRDKNKCAIISEDFIKLYLQHPKEAKFNNSQAIHEVVGSNGCTILNKVITKNSYGVKIEYTYKIWMRHNGGDWTDINNWSWTKIILEDNQGNQSIINNPNM